jgi:hypothetical protein
MAAINTRRATSQEGAAVVLISLADVARDLAARSLPLLQASSRNDEAIARSAGQTLIGWCRDRLSVVLDEALLVAVRMIAEGEPAAGEALTERVNALQRSIAQLEPIQETVQVSIAVIHLRLHFHHLSCVLEAHAWNDRPGGVCTR